ncbi:hypothetical protein E0H73_42790 [Kribbella pittospori]|uniref:Uncharacterized protein n=1 Tax=Kribbella pittospori TaxID=722689 RepID=A0A4R0JTT4_9ACTN|nr:hypothetical protein [Kribbella pittospori]TCC48538.1 hypothetical protein E0H73_42790 [Kribbella pittospori]
MRSRRATSPRASCDLACYIRRTRRSYERLHYLLTSTLRADFADVLEPIESSGGTHMAALLPPGQPSGTLLVARALAEGGTWERSHAGESTVPARTVSCLGTALISADRIPAGLRRVI